MPLGLPFIKGMNYVISETTVASHDGVVTLGGQGRFVFPILLNRGLGGAKMTDTN